MIVFPSYHCNKITSDFVVPKVTPESRHKGYLLYPLVIYHALSSKKVAIGSVNGRIVLFLFKDIFVLWRFFSYVTLKGLYVICHGDTEEEPGHMSHPIVSLAMEYRYGVLVSDATVAMWAGHKLYPLP